MPNYCTGFMNVRGRADCVDEFIAILQANYSYCPNLKNNGDHTWVADPKNFTHIPHFFRVFEAYLMDDPVYHSAVYKSVSISIEVAWSVYSCMFPGAFTYYDDFQKNHFGDHFGSNILIESKRLQLEIEIWSYESGMCFQEHYKICSGILVKDEEFNFKGLWLEDYSNYQEFLNDCNGDVIPLSEQEFNDRIKCEDYWYEYGLHEEDVDFFPEDPPVYLANLVMVKPVKEK
jgi:hypothetical protein